MTTIEMMPHFCADHSEVLVVDLRLPFYVRLPLRELAGAFILPDSPTWFYYEGLIPIRSTSDVGDDPDEPAATEPQTTIRITSAAGTAYGETLFRLLGLELFNRVQAYLQEAHRFTLPERQGEEADIAYDNIATPDVPEEMLDHVVEQLTHATS